MRWGIIRMVWVALLEWNGNIKQQEICKEVIAFVSRMEWGGGSITRMEWCWGSIARMG